MNKRSIACDPKQLIASHQEVNRLLSKVAEVARLRQQLKERDNENLHLKAKKNFKIFALYATGSHQISCWRGTSVRLEIYLASDATFFSWTFYLDYFV